MKSFFSFLAGIVIGVLLCHFTENRVPANTNDPTAESIKKIIDSELEYLDKYIEESISTPKPEVTLFEQPGECVSTSSFVVQRIIDDCYALANIKMDSNYNSNEPYDLEIIIMSDKKDTFYDGQVIKAPKGKCLRQVGIFKMKEYGNNYTTLPIVKIMK